MAKNQARNDASNRAEFLSSLAGKTCARVDAKAIDRDAQMKYDIAKDDCGPLLRSTIKKEIEEDVPSTRYPGLDERLKNIEDHIAVRFGTFDLSFCVRNH